MKKRFAARILNGAAERRSEVPREREKGRVMYQDAVPSSRSGKVKVTAVSLKVQSRSTAALVLRAMSRQPPPSTPPRPCPSPCHVRCGSRRSGTGANNVRTGARTRTAFCLRQSPIQSKASPRDGILPSVSSIFRLISRVQLPASAPFSLDLLFHTRGVQNTRPW